MSLKGSSKHGFFDLSNGSPVDSMTNVWNDHLQTCGEIITVGLAEGGPTLCFLHERLYTTMFKPDVDFKNLDDNDITPTEMIYLETVVSVLRGNSSVIVEH